MKLDSNIISVMKVLDKFFRERGLNYVLIGAQVPKILITSPVLDEHRPTNDIDLTLYMNIWSDFEKLKNDLEKIGFAEDHFELRFVYEKTILELVPYLANEIEDGILTLPQSGNKLNMYGFDRLFKNYVYEEVEEGFKVPVVPLHIFVYTKVLAFLDRGISKDVTKDVEDIIFVMQNYETENQNERRFDTDIPQTINYEFRGAYLLGNDLADYLEEKESGMVDSFLDHFKNEYSPFIQRIGKFNSTRNKEILSLFDSFKIGFSLNSPFSSQEKGRG